jgi:hypothetical protein
MIDNLKIGSQQCVDGLREKDIIFEEGKNEQSNGEAQRKPCLFPLLGFGMIDGLSYIKIDDGGKNQNKQKKATCFIIKEQGYQPQIGIPEFNVFIQKGIKHKDHQEKPPEIQPGKNQGCFCIEEEYLFQLVQHNGYSLYIFTGLF